MGVPRFYLRAPLGSNCLGFRGPLSPYLALNPARPGRPGLGAYTHGALGPKTLRRGNKHNLYGFYKTPLLTSYFVQY